MNSLLKDFRRSLSLLATRDRRLIWVAAVAQMSLSLLDLAGVVLLGVAAGLGMSLVTGSPPPHFLGSWLDQFELREPEGKDLLIWLAIIAGMALLTKTGLSVLIVRRLMRFLARRTAMVSGKLVKELMELPLASIQQRTSQETSFALTNGVQFAILIVISQMTIVMAEGALLTVILVGLLKVDPLTALFAALFFSGVALLLHRFLAGWAAGLGERSSQVDINSLSKIQEALATFRELKVTGRRGTYVDWIEGLRWQAADVNASLQMLGLIPKFVFEPALLIGAGVLAAFQFSRGSPTQAAAIVTLYLAAGARVVPSILRLQGAILGVRSAAAAAAPTYLLADQLRLAGSLEPGAPKPKGIAESISSGGHESHEQDFVPELRLISVSHNYEGSSTPSVSDLSISVKPGTSLALVGPTGAGKSTVADLMLGIAQPTLGEVLICGMTPNEAVMTWPGCIGYVPQHIALVSGTVRDNVALGIKAEEVDEEMVWKALERAHLQTLFRYERDGLDTLVGEGGFRLSGGQRQRLGIARALYTAPRLLILDEATSALDADTELAVTETLADLSGEVTTVIVAHRLSTIRGCSQLIYMENGRVVASGTFEEVRMASEAFDRQAKAMGLG